MSLYKFRWIIDLVQLGTQSDREDDISRRITFSNVVFMTLPIVYLVFMIIDYKSFLQPITNLRFDQFIVPIEIGICFFCLWLNKLGHIYFSRLLFIITWPFFLHIIPIVLLHTPPDYYLAFPFGIVFHGLLIQLMISHRKEPVLFWSLISANFITMIFVSNILEFFVLDGAMPNEIVEDAYYTLDIILYWLLFNMVMYYVLFIVERYIHKVNFSNRLIEKQSEELRQLNQNLEGKVMRRTKKLEEQNEKLRGYAYYNAHLLRAPFCRIQGLVQLMGKTPSNEEVSKEILPRLDENISELEQVISKIRSIVDQEVEDK